MTTYTITNQHGVTSTVRAESHQHAADIFARRANRRYVAIRTTGHEPFSGFFRAYRSAPGGGQQAVSEPFHVTTA